MKIEPDGYDWFERHDKILKYGRETNPEIVFLGDSITHFWAGRDTIGGEFALPRWKKAFGQYRTLNLGYGWDRTGTVRWRLDHGEMDGVDPKLVVIHIGGNNYSTTKHYQGNTSEEVAEAILAIAAKAHEKAPKAKVVVMGVFPFGEKPDAPHRQKALKTNAILAEKVPALGYAAFIDLTSKQIGADGIYPKELARDRVHPTDAGYDIWVEALKPYLPSAVSAAGDRTPVKIISGLADWQIVPREADGFASVALEGTWIVPKAGAHDVFVRVVREDDFSPVCRALDWHAVETDTNGTWRARLRIPCGGLYRLETLRRKRGLRLDWNSKGEGVSHFGVGDVWVIAGQSNADGNGRAPAFDPPEAGVHVFRHCGEWGLASHPLHDGTRSKYAADYMTANHSPWLAFAKKVRARTGVPVGLVPAALGGSGIASWLPERKGELFRAMERICDDACGRRVKGILWYQGCTDTLTPEGTNYYPHLASFIRQARAAFRNPKLPILSVQINRVSNHPAGFWTPPRWDLIREVQRKAAHDFPNHWLVSSMDCVFDDCIHNSSESNVLLGRRVADVALGKVYGFDIACLCPDVRSAVRADDALSVTVAFDNVTGEIVFEPRDPALFPFLLRDEDGEVPLKAVDSTVGDTLVLKLGRALKGKATLVGCPGTCPFIGVPHDMPSYRPMLAFTVEVK